MIAVAVPLAIEAALTAKYLNTTDEAGLSAGVAFLYLCIFIYGIFLDGPGNFYVCHQNCMFPDLSMTVTDLVILTTRQTKYFPLITGQRFDIVYYILCLDQYHVDPGLSNRIYKH